MSTKTKTPVKPLREQIIAFLAGRDEATLKQIAAATTERDFPSRVTTELNKMRTDALVECEKKKGKNELWYWLASPSSAVPDSQPAVEQNTGSSAEDASADPASGAAVQPQSAPAAASSLSAATAAADVKPQTAELPPPITPQIPPPQYDPNSVAFSAPMDAEQDQQRAHLQLIGVLADIRAAVGDPEGKLMQDELVERVRAVAKAGAVANADLVRIRDVLQPLLYTGDPAHAPGPVKCAEHAAQWIQSLGETNREQLAEITAASEALAAVVHESIETSDMDLDELARSVVAQLDSKDEELIGNARVVVDLRTQLANEKALVTKLEHLLQSARNEAEHLRTHAGQTDGIDSAPLSALLKAAARHLDDGQQLTLLPPGAPGTPVHEDGPEVLIKVFGCHFTAPIGSVNHVLDAATTLQRHERRLF